jgi:hypothetical protein
MPAAAKIPVVLYCAFDGCGNRKAHGAGEGLGQVKALFEMSSPEPPMLFIPRSNPAVIHLAEKRAFRRNAAQWVSMRHELLIIGELGATAPIQGIQDHYEDF